MYCSQLVMRPILNLRSFCTRSRYFSSHSSRILRTLEILKGDIKNSKSKFLGKTIDTGLPRYCDVLIIGGGVMGSSIAYWLKQKALDGLSVVVVEKDLSVNNEDFCKYRDSTTVLSVGGLRQQFSLKENIELSLHSSEFLRNIKDYLIVEGDEPPDICFNPSGYLFLASEKSAHILEENASLQKSLGAKVELMSPDQLKSKFPFMNTEGISLGCHGLANEGWFDPWSLLYAFKKKAISLGAHFVQGEVVGFSFKDTSNYETSNDIDFIRNLDSVKVRVSQMKNELEINFGLAILAAGPYSGEVGMLAGIGKQEGILQSPIPVEPRKRYVYNIHCPDGPGLHIPFVIDPSGVYIRREGISGNYLCGKSPLDNEEPPISNLDVDYEFFNERVWPVLASRIPCFDNCKVKSAWAGFYDFNYFDENAIIGFHPAFLNLCIATGFSGHGIQQAPAVGRAVMELVVDGEFTSIDLSRFSFQRCLEREPLWESNVV